MASQPGAPDSQNSIALLEKGLESISLEKPESSNSVFKFMTFSISFVAYVVSD